ncbi:hypothetical protein [Rhodoferax sp.]|uniref:hypothetical protein n=1 Tax=Rhodoferax sp. TaxID=50421 RepID=UPI002751DBE1|nr:hypothetical protein [Rhodoferax sp.]
MQTSTQTTVASILILALLGGCATRPTGEHYRPIVDLRGADATRYESDLSECQAYARQVAGAAEQAAAGALAGAVFGTLLAAVATAATSTPPWALSPARLPGRLKASATNAPSSRAAWVGAATAC